MKVPVTLRIAALAVATTGFYTYVGQLVPQKEVHPPAEVAVSKDMTPEQMQKVGLQLMEGKGLCLTCHNGSARFPDLQGVGSRAGSRVPGMTDVEYLAQSLYEPDTFLVEGFAKGMPPISKPPISLSDDEILTVIAYLQSLGGTTTVTMETKLAWQAGGSGGDAATDAPAAEAPAAPAEEAPATGDPAAPAPEGQAAPAPEAPGTPQ